MRWSKLKQTIERRMAPLLEGRVEVWATRYPKSSDGYGRGWIAVDGHEIESFSDFTYMLHHRLSAKLREEHPDADYYWPFREADRVLDANGVHARWILTQALWDSLSLLINDPLASDNDRARGVYVRR